VRVDGTDFFAVHEAAREAVERARRGDGPSAIEVEMQRFYGHHSGDAQLYRAKDEGKLARTTADPLAIFRRRVTESGLLPEGTFAEIDAEVVARIDGAVAAAKAAPPPAPEALMRDVYISY
jgi:pyruvate dehydrogenase E1 component alpha subunit